MRLPPATTSLSKCYSSSRYLKTFSTRRGSSMNQLASILSETASGWRPSQSQTAQCFPRILSLQECGSAAASMEKHQKEIRSSIIGHWIRVASRTTISSI
ncbi:hypothetical protein GLOTRDRAFT_102906 [Gloeophyllum trabeum ATCC 11539]|uniref:Uncharacterized protein n=1 Tax=Gloeophyllum trabeum (strain ATCC 11539 / FP-39264 / Madison 617) TaxID=670483 RepID=S7QPL5_GLOTA|nr:uncharacterized protein GLOTRDRAFT_102906 [Gloeophyllum trabeum ATCC 11539]EPQ61297.1 hypothetical protein GLOTRDRAFT_102906 [Gloeophyllum trabeum ATCC 11539]